MAEIALTRGMVAIVDDIDAGWLSRWKWHAHQVSGRHYAARNASKAERAEGRPTLIYMHREICDAPQAELVDHADRDTLNNRRLNLRIADHALNGANCERPLGVSGYRGVSTSNRSRPFKAAIQAAGERIHLGYFDRADDAARAYDGAARRLHGEFAFLNFPDERAA